MTFDTPLMDAEYTSCARFANALASAGGKLAEAADALRGWKGVETATHRVSVAADGDASLITLCLEVQTQCDAFWLWLVEVRCNADGWGGPRPSPGAYRGRRGASRRDAAP